MNMRRPENSNKISAGSHLPGSDFPGKDGEESERDRNIPAPHNIKN